MHYDSKSNIKLGCNQISLKEILLKLYERFGISFNAKRGTNFIKRIYDMKKGVFDGLYPPSKFFYKLIDSSFLTIDKTNSYNYKFTETGLKALGISNNGIIDNSDFNKLLFAFIHAEGYRPLEKIIKYNKHFTERMLLIKNNNPIIYKNSGGNYLDQILKKY